MRPLFLSAALGVVALSGSEAFAGPPPTMFTGATWGVGLQGGPTILNDDALGGRVGFTTGVAGRMTGFLHLSDVELAYQVSHAAPSTRAGDVGLWRQGVLATVGLHPLFLLGLGNTRLPYVLSALHVDVGASYQLSTVSTSSDRRTRGDVAWHWGGGLAAPLGDPNKGATYWLGVRYRQIRVNTDLFRDRLPNVGEHQLLLAIEYRWNWR